MEGSATPGDLAPTLTAHAIATLTVAELGAETTSEGATAEAANIRDDLTVAAVQQTALARPTPSLYTFPPTPTSASVPEPTPILGLQPPERCVLSVHGFHQRNCWVVRLDNEYIHVDAGYEFNVRTNDLADVSLGALLVADGSFGVYLTPQHVGPVRVASIDGARVTVMTDGMPPTPVTFVFDLRTHQWVSPWAPVEALRGGRVALLAHRPTPGLTARRPPAGGAFLYRTRPSAWHTWATGLGGSLLVQSNPQVHTR
jgi:hypothetical protein